MQFTGQWVARVREGVGIGVVVGGSADVVRRAEIDILAEFALSDIDRLRVGEYERLGVPTEND
jgi:hypothetical protein